MEFINKYPNKKWCWGNISRHKNTTIEIIENNLDKPWNWDSISYNKNRIRCQRQKK